jgi:hypothetical protein
MVTTMVFRSRCRSLCRLQWLTSELASQTGSQVETEVDLMRALDQPWNGITLDADQCNMFEFYDLAIDVDVRF